MMRVLSTLIVVVFLISCRSTKKIQTAIAQKDTAITVHVMTAPVVESFDSAAYMRSILHSIDSARIDFKTFSAKIDVDYRDADGKKYNLNVNVRILKDSAIWMLVTAMLGIEAFRLIITKDSVKMLNKQEKLYTVRSIDYLQEITSLPFNLSVLQDLIIGNAIFLDSNVVSFTNKDNTVSILSIGKWFKNLTTINENDKTLVRCKLDDADFVKSRTADLSYSNYTSIANGILFAEKRKITIVEKKKLDVGLNFKQYEVNGEVNFPFPIPKNYKRNKI